MTGQVKVKPAKTDAEWARNTEKRLNAAENPTSVRIGEWVLSTAPDTGNLLASHVDGGSIVLAVKPAASADPDSVVDTKLPYIKIQRQINQSAARGAIVLVQWDTIVSQTSNWGFAAPGTDISVPITGVYEVKYHLAFLNSASANSEAVLQVNGSVVEAQEYPSGTVPSIYICDTYTWNAGDIINCGAYVGGSGTMDFGSSGTRPNVHTSLSIQLISKEG